MSFNLVIKLVYVDINNDVLTPGNEKTIYFRKVIYMMPESAM